MEAVGSVVLVVVTAAVGIGALLALVQLWRHQPVHEDDPTGRFEDDDGDDPGDEADEATVAIGRDGDADLGEDDDPDAAPTKVLGRRT